MLYEMREKCNFNIPNDRFIEDVYYTTYSRVGGIIKGGYESPNGASGISMSKKEAFIKSYSEYLERRLLITGSNTKKRYLEVFNLLTDNIEKIPVEYSMYSQEGPHIIDTTGTATHYSSSKVIYNALRELLEKNALFTFWYGEIGYLLKHDETILNHSCYKKLKSSNRDVLIFLNDTFNPLKVIFTLVLEDDKVYSCGIGSDINIESAIDHSLKETILLHWTNTMNLQFGIIPRFAFQPQEVLNNHISKLKKMPTYNYSGLTSTIDKKNNGLSYILSNCPEWLESLYVIFLNNTKKNISKTVKVFSYELYNHVPLKEKLVVDRKINLETLNLTTNQIEKMPDTIFI